MIFAPALSLLGFLVLVILPLVGVLGTIPMVGIVIARSCKKHPPLSRKARTWMWALAAFLAVADLWTGLLFYQFHSVARDVDEKHANRVARENFILDRDFQYGELAIPAGSQINRYDPFDNGEKDAPLGLRGLRAVRFPHPVRVAGVSTEAMDVSANAKLVLAEDQTIGPLFAYNAKGKLSREGQPASVTCKRGQVASFDVPSIPYDIVAEFSKPAPDGPDARFKPSQWQFLGCQDDASIDLPPVIAPR
ncbi:hypothetical protein [uncultured Ralstonia sp.]|jgi:hypothetical protein|uniref:hypothetical protein n=1 Tax=Ralstonia sp. TaxID=54061 RepID=UPI0025F9FD8C|nr:hypothetical protein [uncultured Ralstonia sp.]